MMRAGTHHSDDTKQALLRESQRRTNKTRDHVLLRQMREAETAALPPRKQEDDRQCLGCRRWFASEWCGNRLCDNCKHQADAE